MGPFIPVLLEYIGALVLSMFKLLATCRLYDRQARLKYILYFQDGLAESLCYIFVIKSRNLLRQDSQQSMHVINVMFKLVVKCGI
jgi:hypothetical protein